MLVFEAEMVQIVCKLSGLTFWSEIRTPRPCEKVKGGVSKKARETPRPKESSFQMLFCEAERVQIVCKQSSLAFWSEIRTRRS